MDIAVLAADRTDSAATLRADRMHGHRQNDVLPKDIIELQPAAVIKADFGFPLMQLHLFGRPARRYLRAIKQVQFGVDRELRRFKATAAIGFHSDAQVAANADLAERV